ncbi:hypothetical protein KC669_00410 [Candidatus Dojkabacteria bacterium]|uniref:Uncharacterized protein n=1 Tax=Candidatus Dojkabacteria bacterium TaxID=2099670 RepID=A0A955L9U1_9BACT|nr:hypothetical protein [Candidatus Dojkabacteria bacterium]
MEYQEIKTLPIVETYYCRSLVEELFEKPIIYITTEEGIEPRISDFAQGFHDMVIANSLDRNPYLDQLVGIENYLLFQIPTSEGITLTNPKDGIVLMDIRLEGNNIILNRLNTVNGQLIYQPAEIPLDMELNFSVDDLVNSYINQGAEVSYSVSFDDFVMPNNRNFSFFFDGETRDISLKSGIASIDINIHIDKMGDRTVEVFEEYRMLLEKIGTGDRVDIIASGQTVLGDNTQLDNPNSYWSYTGLQDLASLLQFNTDNNELYSNFIKNVVLDRPASGKNSRFSA